MDYLENVTVNELQEILAELDEKKPVQRILAGIACKDGVEQQTIAERHDVHPNTVRNWLTRLERLESEPFEEVVYDAPRPGQSRELSEDEHDRFVEALHDSPEEVGLDARAWTVPLARQYLEDEFDVEYCRRHVRRLMAEAGLSWKTARPEYADADERAQDAFREGLKKDGRSGRRLHNHSNRPDTPRDNDRPCPRVVSRRKAPDTPGVGRVGESQTAGRCHRRR